MKRRRFMALIEAITDIADPARSGPTPPAVPIMKQSEPPTQSNQIAAYPLGSVGEQRLYDAIPACRD